MPPGVSADIQFMERRREPRFAMDQPVVVTVLDGREIRRRSQMTNASAWGIGLEMQCAVPPGALMRIEFEETVVLGEVAHCREAAGSYYVGVKLEQALKSLSGLDAKWSGPPGLPSLQSH